jgi:hypothetical protein
MIVWLNSISYQEGDTIPQEFCLLEITNSGRLFLRLSVENNEFWVRTNAGYLSTPFEAASLSNYVTTLYLLFRMGSME